MQHRAVRAIGVVSLIVDDYGVAHIPARTLPPRAGSSLRIKIPAGAWRVSLDTVAELAALGCGSHVQVESPNTWLANDLAADIDTQMQLRCTA